MQRLTTCILAYSLQFPHARDVNAGVSEKRLATLVFGRDGHVESFCDGWSSLAPAHALARGSVLDVINLSEASAPALSARMLFWISNIFGADELQWLLASEEPPPSARLGDNTVALMWEPIYEDGAVAHIRLTATDAPPQQRAVASDQAVADFAAEAHELLDQCDDALTANSPSRLFRLMHTIKGAAPLGRADEVRDEAHRAETLLQKLRDGAIAVSRGVMDALRGSVGAMRGQVDALGPRNRERAGLDSLFGRLRQMVADLAPELGKEIVLEVCGRVTVPPARVVAVRDMLIHALRNAMDHGIESPQARQAAGKPAMGTVTIRCREEADRVVFEIADDGRGMQAATVPRVFEPGFTTADEVTMLSGRGVGTDVIRTTARECGGDATIASTLGEGTTLTVWISHD